MTATAPPAAASDPDAGGSPVDPRVALAQTRAWVERAVVGLNLCPFAKGPVAAGRVRWVVCEASAPDALLAVLCAEMDALVHGDARRVETTLLVHPNALRDFEAFNDFLDVVDAALEATGHDGVLQVATFHPDYRFAGTAADDIGNATNRSPYPTLQLLREASVERAVDAIARPEAIYEANIATLEALGASGWAELQARCRADAEREAEAEADAGPHAGAADPPVGGGRAPTNPN